MDFVELSKFPGKGFSSLIAKAINYIIRKRSNKSGHETHEINGEYVFTWWLRICGGWAILVSFFGAYLILFSK